jgi:uncharacterized membrane protein
MKKATILKHSWLIVPIFALIASVMLIFASRCHGVDWSLPQPKEYRGAVFQWYVITDLGTFTIYQTTYLRLNKESHKRTEHISFPASAFSDLDAMEIWHTTQESLEYELGNIEDKESFRRAVRQDEIWEAEHRHEEMRRWINDRHFMHNHGRGIR